MTTCQQCDSFAVTGGYLCGACWEKQVAAEEKARRESARHLLCADDPLLLAMARAIVAQNDATHALQTLELNRLWKQRPGDERPPVLDMIANQLDDADRATRELHKLLPAATAPAVELRVGSNDCPRCGHPWRHHTPGGCGHDSCDCPDPDPENER